MLCHASYIAKAIVHMQTGTKVVIYSTPCDTVHLLVFWKAYDTECTIVD